jgi:hypothetical protein
MFVPVLSDVHTTANPHVILGLYIIEKPSEGTSATGAACEPTVETDRH